METCCWALAAGYCPATAEPGSSFCRLHTGELIWLEAEARLLLALVDERIAGQ